MCPGSCYFERSARKKNREFLPRNSPELAQKFIHHCIFSFHCTKCRFIAWGYSFRATMKSVRANSSGILTSSRSNLARYFLFERFGLAAARSSSSAVWSAQARRSGDQHPGRAAALRLWYLDQLAKSLGEAVEAGMTRPRHLARLVGIEDFSQSRMEPIQQALGHLRQ